ncbi:MAG: DUF4129 domain-containing protein [Planctomycetes bacterium]|nr:DUF4129 domain-containing protein [Planctomycetota bacterium]
MRRSVPERPLRILILIAACVPPPILLSMIDSDLGDWQHPALWVFGLLLASLLCVRGEQHPALMDEEPALRAKRYSMFVAPLLLVTAFLFPYTISWALLWALSLVLIYLLAFAYVPFVRTMALATATTLSLGLTVLDPPLAAPLLAAPALAWVALPALEASARSRLSLTAAHEPRLGWPLTAIAGCLALGTGVFAAAWSLLPPTHADFRQVGLLRSAGGQVVLRPGPLPAPPWFEIGTLVVLVVVGLVLMGRLLAGSNKQSREGLDLPVDMSWQASTLRARREQVKGDWPTSTRLALIERYLLHLARLGLDPTPQETPALLLARVPEPERARAAQLAERFERARWSSQPVAPGELEAARADAEAIEAACAESTKNK